MDDLSHPFGKFARDLAPANRRSLADEITDRLRLSIVRGDFAAGEHLSEAALAQALGTSRGPIREALVELERVGLLTIERHRGARIMKLTREDVTEIYELRRALERLAIERAVTYAGPEDFEAMDSVIEEMRAAVDDGDAFRVVELDMSFHDAVARAARHSRLYVAWSRLRPQVDFFLNSRARDTASYFKIAVAEHTALRDIIRTGTPSGATDMIDEHLLTAYDRLTQLPL